MWISGYTPVARVPRDEAQTDLQKNQFPDEVLEKERAELAQERRSKAGAMETR